MVGTIHIIGMGEGTDIDTKIQAILKKVQAIYSSQRLLDRIDSPATKHAWCKPFSKNIDAIEQVINDTDGDVAILATGDPSNFGIATIILRHFYKEDVLIYPHAGAFSYMSASMGWATQDCVCMTIHGRPIHSVLPHLTHNRKILVLSHNANSPVEMATLLVEKGFGESQISVLENLGSPCQRVTHHTANSLSNPHEANFEFDALNSMAIHCVGVGYSLTGGLPDDVFLNDGQLTKREVRSTTLSALQPKYGEVLWDIGSGSGSISIEWTRLGGFACAVEKNEDRIENLNENAKNLGATSLQIYSGNASDIIEQLPSPDAIFIGGGITDTATLRTCIQALKVGGRFVANTVTIEGESILTSLYNQYGGHMCRISVDRLVPVGGFKGWKPLMPVTQYCFIKSDDDTALENKSEATI